MTIDKAYNKTPKSTLANYITLAKVSLYIVIQFILSFIPIKKNRIMIYTHYRKGYACNPKYVVEKILEKHDGEYEMLWVTQYPDSCKNVPKSVKVIRANSLEHKIKYIRTAMYITNDCFPAWAMHWKKHVWINLWHGGINYKHIGYDYIKPMSKARMKWFRLTNRQPDYFLSASSFFTEDTKKSFGFNEECFVELGLPRNDIFFKKDMHIKEQVISTLGLKKEKRIVLYAPTFRDYSKTIESLDIAKIKNALAYKFGGEWVVLFRKHYFGSINFEKDIDIDVSDYGDMNELLYISDVLISDYSSCMYDFSLQYKPCFVFAPDMDEYETKDRSFAYPVSKWPYMIAKTNEQLVFNIVGFEESIYIKKLKEHFIDVGSKDNGTASEKMVSLIDGISRGEYKCHQVKRMNYWLQ